jgi:hypothetical protein
VENTNPEQPIEVKGEPITFMASVNNDGATRANVAGTLEGFTLWGVQDNAVSTTETGLTYRYSGVLEAWVKEGENAPTYDTGDTPVPYYFYAMALGNDPITSNEDGYNASNNAAKANAITFGDDGVSTNTNGEIKIKGTYIENKPLLLTGGNYDAKRFQYTMKTQTSNASYLDLDNQEDLLVAHSFGDGTSTAGWTTGAVPLSFDHALANIELNLALPQSTWEAGEVINNYGFSYDNITTSGVFAVVSSITIHGLKKTGTYTFGTGWSDPDGSGEIKLEYPTGLFFFGKFFDLPDDDEYKATVISDATERRKYERATYFTPIVTGEKSIMVIPQAFTPWNKTASIENSSNQCYIEIEAEILYDAATAQETEEKWTEEREDIVKAWVRNWTLYGGNEPITLEDTYNLSVQMTALTDFGENPAQKTTINKFYIPFSVSSNTLLQNKRYKLYIDLYHLLDATGQPALDFWNP